MRRILSLSISILSIIIGGIVIIGYFIVYEKPGRDTAFWVLLIFGAPTTFLYFFIEKIGFIKNYYPSYVSSTAVCFFYLLQYQLIALSIYKRIINFSSRIGIICSLIVFIIILISSTIMYNILLKY